MTNHAVTRVLSCIYSIMETRAEVFSTLTFKGITLYYNNKCEYQRSFIYPLSLCIEETYAQKNYYTCVNIEFLRINIVKDNQYSVWNVTFNCQTQSNIQLYGFSLIGTIKTENPNIMRYGHYTRRDCGIVYHGITYIIHMYIMTALSETFPVLFYQMN